MNGSFDVAAFWKLTSIFIFSQSVLSTATVIRYGHEINFYKCSDPLFIVLHRNGIQQIVCIGFGGGSVMILVRSSFTLFLTEGDAGQKPIR